MKIIKSKKYKIIESERRDPIEEVPDPYAVNFSREEEKARGMSTSSLFFALQDAIEASQLSPNAGKYFDQASVYRRELQNRKISIPEQDEKLKTIPSQHPKQQYEPFGHTPQDIKDIPMELEDDNSVPGVNF